MKSFSRPQYRLANASLEVKLIYTFFLIFLLIGFLTICGYEFQEIGWSTKAIAEHYRGAEGGELSFPRSFQTLLETTHFHAFVMGIIYLTLAHLFIASDLSKKVKIAIIVTGFIATFLDLVLPWAIRYCSGQWSGLLVVSWIGEWISYMAMILFSFRELWFRPIPVPDDL